MKVFDCFLFCHELSLLEIRLNELKSVVTNSLIVEANITGAKVEKEFTDLTAFSNFNITHHKVNLRNFRKQTDYEDRHYLILAQRDFMKSALENMGAQDDDVILFSDLDEIPRKETVIEYIEKKIETPRVVSIRGYYWYCDTPIMSPPNHAWFKCPILIRYKDFKNEDLTKLRQSKDTLPEITGGGWHFSHTGTIEDKVLKMKASSHIEYGSDHYTSPDMIRYRSNLLIDPYDRGYSISSKNDYPLPEYLENNREKFKHLLKNYV